MLFSLGQRTTNKEAKYIITNLISLMNVVSINKGAKTKKSKESKPRVI